MKCGARAVQSITEQWHGEALLSSGMAKLGFDKKRGGLAEQRKALQWQSTALKSEGKVKQSKGMAE